MIDGNERSNEVTGCLKIRAALRSCSKGEASQGLEPRGLATTARQLWLQAAEDRC